MNSQTDEFDYVVVGSGSSGSVLAGRLAERGDCTVAVIEAGRRRWPKISAIPGAASRTIGHPSYDWCYTSEPDPTRHGRTESWPRGKGLGGSSLINGMIFVRGNPRDYDAWAAAGAPGWDYPGVLPYFRRIESSGILSQERGALGPLPVSPLRYRFSLTEAFLDAAEKAGMPRNPDYNGAEQFGFGPVQVTQSNGRRVSAYDAFLAPWVRRGAVKLYEDAHVTRLTIKDGRAVGAEVECDGHSFSVKARRSVVLAAGSVNTPHLLMLSGIGPADQLRNHGIDVLRDVREVGQNMVEHVGIWMSVTVDEPTLNREAKPIRMAAALARWAFTGSGPAAASPAQAVGFVHKDDPFGRADIQIHLAPLAIERDAKGKLFIPDEQLISVVPSVNHPHSRGAVRLGGANPRQAPVIEPRLLDDDRDVATLKQGVRICEEILATDPIRAHVKGMKHAPPTTEREFDDYVRGMAAPLYHIVGTCRMGQDENAVVGPDLRVKNIKGLMVADSSIMPCHVSGNTHAASLMIGEKASDLLTS